MSASERTQTEAGILWGSHPDSFPFKDLRNGSSTDDVQFG